MQVSTTEAAAAVRKGWPQHARKLTLLLMAGLTAAALGGSLHAEDRHATELEQMHEACVTAMIKSTCQVVVGSAPADAASTVVIAGVGRIDAAAYRSLRASGDAMCGIARTSCEKAWDGPSCTSARALWSLALAEP